MIAVWIAAVALLLVATLAAATHRRTGQPGAHRRRVVAESADPQWQALRGAEHIRRRYGPAG